MWNKLDHQKKNWALVAIMVVTLYVAYSFSLKHTFEALSLNHQLTKEEEKVQTEDSTFPQINRKNSFYNEALKGYQVRSEDREIRLWQAVSNIAISKNVKINFNPNQPTVTDTVALQKGMVTQQFTFKGDYFKLVKLLDTLSKSSDIGKIAELKLNNKKEMEGNNKENELMLQLSLTAIGN